MRLFLKIRSKLIYLVFILCVLLNVACSQDEGIGGDSTLKGQLIERFYIEDSSVLLYEQECKDADVFILFGQDNTIGEKVETSFSGDFEFNYLWPGNYTIFYYSENKENSKYGDEEILVEVSIGKGETLDLGQLIVNRTLDWNDGNASISGQLTERFYNDDYSILLHEQACKDEDVFILFGQDETVGEKVETSHTGAFKFSSLWPGDYKVFYYSENTENPELGDEEVIIDVTIDTDQSKDLGSLVVNRTLDWDEGTATIKGNVVLVNYQNGSEWPNLVIKDVSPAQEQEVYLTYGTHEIYDERIRTDADGSFVFQNLIKGNYTIYVYSEDLTGATKKKVVEFEVVINDANEIVVLDPIRIDKL